MHPLELSLVLFPVGFLLVIALVRIIQANRAIIRDNHYPGIVATILRRIGVKDVALIVLLKGVPNNASHMSVVSTKIALELAIELKRVIGKRGVTVILCGGVTAGKESEASAAYRLLHTQDNQLTADAVRAGVIVKKEEQSVTTRTNMHHAMGILVNQFDRTAAVIVSSAERPFGHAQRGYMIGLKRYAGIRLKEIPVVGIVPLNKLSRVFHHNHLYDFGTCVLTALGLSRVLDWVVARQLKRHGRRYQYTDK